MIGILVGVRIERELEKASKKMKMNVICIEVDR